MSKLWCERNISHVAYGYNGSRMFFTGCQVAAKIMTKRRVASNLEVNTCYTTRLY